MYGKILSNVTCLVCYFKCQIPFSSYSPYCDFWSSHCKKNFFYFWIIFTIVSEWVQFTMMYNIIIYNYESLNYGLWRMTYHCLHTGQWNFCSNIRYEKLWWPSGFYSRFLFILFLLFNTLTLLFLRSVSLVVLRPKGTDFNGWCGTRHKCVSSLNTRSRLSLVSRVSSDRLKPRSYSRVVSPISLSEPLPLQYSKKTGI